MDGGGPESKEQEDIKKKRILFGFGPDTRLGAFIEKNYSDEQTQQLNQDSESCKLLSEQRA